MVPIDAADDELDLRHYLDVLSRRKWLILAVAAAVTILAIGLSARQTPMYRSTAAVLLQSDDAERRLSGAADLDARAAQSRVATEIGVIESNLVRSAVAETLGREPDVSVRAVGDTDIIEISATAEQPDEAAAEANRYARTYVDWKRERTIDDLLAAQRTVQEQIDALQAELDRSQRPLEDLEFRLFAADSELERNLIRDELAAAEERLAPEVSAIQSSLSAYRTQLSTLQLSQRVIRTGGVQIISEASPADEPFAPQPLRNGVLGGVVGLILGVVLAFLRETLDDRIRTTEQLERLTGWPTIGNIPVIETGKEGRDLVTLDAPSSPATEAYRSLRTAVQFLGLDRPLDAIQVTSARPEEGKSTTASNLAVILAKAGKRVILLDADLRKPRLHREFDIPNDVGFTSMLLDAKLVPSAFHRTSVANLVVVPAGPPPPNPSELLGLSATRQVLQILRDECDVLIVDSPPVLPVTDPLIISGYVDGVIVVADARSITASTLGRARDLLTQVNANVAGVCVNRVGDDDGYGYGYGYGYGDAVQEPSEPAAGSGDPSSQRHSLGSS